MGGLVKGSRGASADEKEPVPAWSRSTSCVCASFLFITLVGHVACLLKWPSAAAQEEEKPLCYG